MRAVRIALACLIAVCLALPASALAADRATEAMLAKVNKARAHNGLKPLRESPSLERSSRRFAGYLMGHDVFAHRARVSANHRRFRRLGEALAMHSGHKRGIGMTLREWLASPVHRALVLTRSMRWVGAGMSRGRFGGGRAVIWVLQVGSR